MSSSSSCGPAALSTAGRACAAVGPNCLKKSSSGAFPTQPEGSFPTIETLPPQTAANTVFGCLLPAVTPSVVAKKRPVTRKINGKMLVTATKKLWCDRRPVTMAQDDGTADLNQDDEDEMPLLDFFFEECEPSWSFEESNMIG